MTDSLSQASDITDRIKRNLVHFFKCFGDQARYDHFVERVESAPYGNIHRTAFLELKRQAKWAAIAEGLQEWTKIGFDVLAGTHPKWQNEATMNSLFAALHKEMLREDYLKVSHGGEFADAWSTLVRDWRSDGY